jgi:hypothetical protein
MSLQTLKLKAISNATNQSNSSSSTGGFSINSGPRQLNYTGKSMRNSAYKTPFKGNYPVNFNGNAQHQHITYPGCDTKFELRGQEPITQKPVVNNKAMLSKKYKWINGGVYPNIWVQPPQKTYSEYHADLHCPCDDASGSTISPEEACVNSQVCKNALDDMGVHPNRNRIQRLKLINSKIVNVDANVKSVSESEYIKQLQCKCIQPKCDNKPFPYFTTNPGMNTSALVSCGGASEAQEAYMTAPKWYIDCSGRKVEAEEQIINFGEDTSPELAVDEYGYKFNIIYNTNITTPRFAFYTMIDGLKYYVVTRPASNTQIFGSTIKTVTTIPRFATLFSINDSIYESAFILTMKFNEKVYYLYNGDREFMLLEAKPDNEKYLSSNRLTKITDARENLAYQNMVVFTSKYLETDVYERRFYAQLIR